MKKNIFWAGVLLALTAAGFLFAPGSAEAQHWRGQRGGAYVNPYYGGYSNYHPGYHYARPYGGYYGYPGYNYGYSRYNYAYPRYYTGWYPSYSYYAPTYSYAPSAVYVPTPTTNEIQVVSTAPARETAHFVIHVPVANAEVWIDGRATSQTGLERHFETPLLEPGQAYTFEFRARWMDDGGPRQQTKMVTFRAGETNHVDFNIGGTE